MQRCDIAERLGTQESQIGGNVLRRERTEQQLLVVPVRRVHVGLRDFGQYQQMLGINDRRGGAIDGARLHFRRAAWMFAFAPCQWCGRGPNDAIRTAFQMCHGSFDGEERRWGQSRRVARMRAAQ